MRRLIDKVNGYEIYKLVGRTGVTNYSVATGRNAIPLSVFGRLTEARKDAESRAGYIAKPSVALEVAS